MTAGGRRSALDTLAFRDSRRTAVWLRRGGSGAMGRAHRHADLELNLVMAGSCAYLVGERRVDLVAGALFFLHPAQDHILIDESPDLRMWIAVYQPGLIAEQVARGLDPATAAADPGPIAARRLPPDRVRALDRLCAEATEGEGAGADLGTAFLLWQARAAWAAAADTASLAVHPAVVRAARLLREDPGQRVAAVAATVGLGPDHLTRRFRAEIGCTLAEYRARVRLDQVVDGWNAGERDLLRLAMATGFGSYSAFHRAFRARFAGSPRDRLAAVAGERSG
jgi:AraC-like DNA-binding protein